MARTARFVPVFVWLGAGFLVGTGFFAPTGRADPIIDPPNPACPTGDSVDGGADWFPGRVLPDIHADRGKIPIFYDSLEDATLAAWWDQGGVHFCIPWNDPCPNRGCEIATPLDRSTITYTVDSTTAMLYWEAGVLHVNIS